MSGETTCQGSRWAPLRWIEPLALCVAVLDVPKLSTIAAYGLFAGRLIWWTARPRVSLRLAARLLLLAAFAASYYGVSLTYGYGDLDTAIKSIVLIVGFYAVGYAAGDREDRLLRASFAIVGGFVIFAALSVVGAVDRSDVVGIADREVASFWSATEIINAPGMGAFASLGICLLPAVLLSGGAPGPSAWGRRAWILLSLSLAVVGFYTNLQLENRTPVLALAAAVIASGLFAVRARRGARRLGAVLAVTAAGIAAYLLAMNETLAAHLSLFGRFRARGLSTERYAAWAAMLKGMLDHPTGGRTVELGGLHYVHDLWLDTAYQAGLVPMALLVAFQLSHVGVAWRTLRSGAPFVSFVLIGVGASYLATFAAEPTLQFSVPYFATSGFFLGLVLRRHALLEAERDPARLRPPRVALAVSPGAGAS